MPPRPDDVLEPGALQGARPVLRGEGGSDALPPTRLPDGFLVPNVVPTTHLPSLQQQAA